MTPEALDIIERLFKAMVFVPTIALVAWWVFFAWAERVLDATEAWIATGLLLLAFILGVSSIIAGGWGFLGIIAIIYLALLALAVYEYVYWRRREREHYLAALERYRAASEKDPANLAARSYLGETYLKLGRFEEAETILREAVEKEPTSHRDRRLLHLAEARRLPSKWKRVD